MKIRTGFVSNSSTSSFILVLRETKYAELIAKEHPTIKYIAEKLGRKKTFEGQPVRVISWLEGNLNSLDELDSCFRSGPIREYKGDIGNDWGKFTRTAGDHGLLTGIGD